MLAAQDGVERRAIWKRLRTGGVLPADDTQVGYKAAGLTREHRDFVIGGVLVDRDPCPRCGVRGDIPCGHSRAPLGMRL
jgi:hypothetical protein